MGGSSTRSTRQASASRRAIRSCNVIFVIITILGVFITACLPNPPATPDTKQGNSPAAKQSTPATTKPGNPSAAKPASAPTRVPGGPAKPAIAAGHGWPSMLIRDALLYDGPGLDAGTFSPAPLARGSQIFVVSVANARFHAFETDIHRTFYVDVTSVAVSPEAWEILRPKRTAMSVGLCVPGQDVIADETMRELYGALALSMSPYLQESMPGLTVTARDGATPADFLGQVIIPTTPVPPVLVDPGPEPPRWVPKRHKEWDDKRKANEAALRDFHAQLATIAQQMQAQLGAIVAQPRDASSNVSACVALQARELAAVASTRPTRRLVVALNPTLAEPSVPPGTTLDGVDVGLAVHCSASMEVCDRFLRRWTEQIRKAQASSLTIAELPGSFTGLVFDPLQPVLTVTEGAR